MTTPDTRAGGREGATLGDEQSLPGTEQTGQAGAGIGGSAREQVRQVKDKVVDQAKSTFQDARDRAGSGLAQGRRQAADQLGGIGSALHRTGEQLRSEDQARFADLADSVGRKIDRTADYLRNSDGRAIARDVENLARRQPALVFAGAFALGLLAARFLKSSDPGSRDDRSFDAGSRYDPDTGGFDA